MRLMIISFLISFSFLSLAQTHTNRGGKGPELDKRGECNQLLYEHALALQLSYIQANRPDTSKRKEVKKDQIEKEFKDLISTQNLLIDLNLIKNLPLTDCKKCESHKVEILKELLEFLERNHHCPGLDKYHDLKPFIKNIIKYDQRD
jgi:hypothetical protein